MNYDFLFYGGCFCLQTGNITLAFTDAMGDAMEAAKELGSQATPYWTSYTINFDTDADRDKFKTKVNECMGIKYLGPFVSELTMDHVTLSGFCVI